MFSVEENNETMNRLGFCKIQGFSQGTISALLHLYKQHFTLFETDRDLMVTHNHKSNPSPLLIHEEICKIVTSDLQKIVPNCTIFASHFAVKKAKSQGAFQLHQDWTVTDETQYKNFQIWIPLETSYPENGGLCFIPESHTFFNNLRSGSFSIPRIPIGEKLYSYLSFYRLLRGEAVAFFTRTLHGSFINSSDSDRVGVILNMLEKDAPSLYYHKKDTNECAIYPLNTASLFSNLPQLEKGEMPFNQALETKNIGLQDNEEIDEKALLQLIKRNAINVNREENYEHKECQILRDSNLEKEINANGFAIIDFLSNNEIEKLKTVFEFFFPNRSLFTGSFSSMSALDNVKRQAAHQSIQQIIHSRLSDFFDNFKCPVSLLYSRRPDGQHKLDWHSDPAFNLNEHIVPIYGIWCPLQEVTEKHGGLQLIPKSHRLIPKLNLSYVNWKWPLEPFRGYLDQFGRSFSLKAGQALIYDTRMIHASKPNTTDIERDNIVMRICPQHAQFFKFVKLEANVGEIYSVNDSFFFRESAKKHTFEPEKDVYFSRNHDMMQLFDYEISKFEIDKKLKNKL